MSHLSLQKNISRLMALLLAVMLLLPCIPAARAEGESGSCGENLSWSLNAGTLTITGSGEMADYSIDNMAPWYDYRDQILQLELPEGLETIGSMAFYECKNLMTVKIPDSVKKIGVFAFSDCEALKMVAFGSNLQGILEAAFQNCYSLKSISLPKSLMVIGVKAFYRCEEITTLRIPSGVVVIGKAAFGYCKSLVSADIQCRMESVPEFMFYACENLTTISLPDTTSAVEDLAFYGCDQLETVHYNGSNQSLEEAQKAMEEKNQSGGSTSPEQTGTQPTAPQSPIVSNPVQKPVTSAGKPEEEETGKREEITAVQGEDATGSLTVEVIPQEGAEDEVNVDLTITVSDPDGWQEAEDILDDLLIRVEPVIPPSERQENVTVEVYIENTEDVDPDFLENLAGEPITVVITTSDGFTWKVDCSKLDPKKDLEKLNLRYILSDGSEDLCSELGVRKCFLLKFQESSEIHVEVMVRVGREWAGHTATLIQNLKGENNKIQSSVVDRDGFAHFYLASIDSRVEYRIAMDLDEPAENAVVPEEMHQEYKEMVQHSPIQYEITGRKSSWNMGLGKVMAILAVVMVSVIVVVGFVMYFWNKQKLKNGYIPDLDDDE